MRYLSQCRASLLSLALIGAATAAAFSSEPAHATVDQTTAAPATQINADALSRAQAKLARAQAIAARHADQAAALGYNDNAWRYELIAHLMSADAQTLTEIEADADLATTLKHASRAAAQADSVQPKSIGDVSDDLVFTPITPCRIIDTRNAGAGGAFEGIKTYTYTGSTAQGGSNCVSSTVTPGALALNVTIQTIGIGTSATLGHLSVYPQGSNPDASSWMNYTGNEIEANAGVATINQSNGEFSVYAQITTQLIVDVFGVLRPPQEAGVNNYVAKWTPNGNTLGNSLIYDDGTHLGIGTAVPSNQLQIGAAGLAGFSGNLLAMGNGLQGMAFYQTSATSVWSSSSNFSLMPVLGSGLVGLGTTTPAYSLDIASSGNAQINLTEGTSSKTAMLSRYNNRFEIQPSDGFQVSIGEAASPDLFVASNHDVGVGTTMPVNTLQVGSIGSVNFNGNQFAFGNGTDASAMAQAAPSGAPPVAWWYSTTNIALLPQSGSGFVGIDTITPQAPLDVEDYTVYESANAHGVFSFSPSGGVVVTTVNDSPNVSIQASGDVFAAEFDAASDARIKDIHGISDSHQDLQALNQIQVTDYSMKDTVKFGRNLIKKVIAQQVEAVYPQVISKHSGFIPNVYQLTSQIESSNDGYVLTFAEPHHLTNSAKQLKLQAEGSHTMQQAEIFAIPSDFTVVVKVPNWTASSAFVYGEEVDDFRTVDYDGLTTLNISATQELSKRLAQQQTAMIELTKDKDAQIAALRDELRAEQTRVTALEHTALDLAELKAQVAALKQSRDLPSGISVAMQK